MSPQDNPFIDKLRRAVYRGKLDALVRYAEDAHQIASGKKPRKAFRRPSFGTSARAMDDLRSWWAGSIDTALFEQITGEGAGDHERALERAGFIIG